MQPLADKIRPQKLDEFIGQKHLVGEGNPRTERAEQSSYDGKPLRVAIEQRHLFRLFCGVRREWGKQRLARIYAKELDAEFLNFQPCLPEKRILKRL